MKIRLRKHRRPVRAATTKAPVGFVLFRRWVSFEEACALFAGSVDPEPKPA